MSLVLLLASALLAILAAARWVVYWPGAYGLPVTIVIDAGRTAPSSDAVRAAARRLQPELLKAFGPGPVDLVVLPSEQVVRTNRSDWAALPNVRASAVETADELRSSVADALRGSRSPVVVISNQVPDSTSPLVIAAPMSPSTPRNIGFVAASARESPRPQWMARIRNDSDRTSARLVVSAGSTPIERTIDLPPAGETRNYFVDLPRMIDGAGEAIGATLEADDDIPADNTAWLVRRRTWPEVECRPGVPSEILRIVNVYSKLRPPRESSTRVAVVDGVFNLPREMPAIGVFNGAAKSPASRSSARLRVVEHPLTAYVGWAAATRDAAAPASPGEGWQTLVSAGGQVYLAAREQPARQVWCALASPDWPQSADFVVFWTNALDWTGQGSNVYEAGVPEHVHASWTKVGGPADLDVGLYRRPDGSAYASNAFGLRAPGAADTKAWRERLADVTGRRSTRPIDIAVPALLCSVMLVIAATALGTRSTLPAGRVKR